MEAHNLLHATSRGRATRREALSHQSALPCFRHYFLEGLLALFWALLWDGVDQDAISCAPALGFLTFI